MKQQKFMSAFCTLQQNFEFAVVLSSSRFWAPDFTFNRTSPIYVAHICISLSNATCTAHSRLQRSL